MPVCLRPSRWEDRNACERCLAKLQPIWMEMLCWAFRSGHSQTATHLMWHVICLYSVLCRVKRVQMCAIYENMRANAHRATTGQCEGGTTYLRAAPQTLAM
jgi:hypothetical protein